MSRNRCRKKRRPNERLNYSSLEPRQLLATLFTGTNSSDVAEVTYVDETHVNVLIGETLTENVDISDGIRIDLKVHSFQYVGHDVAAAYDQITIDHRITGDLQIFNAEIIRVDGGDNQWQLGFIPYSSVANETAGSSSFRIAPAGIFAGRLNDNITFRDFRTVFGGDGKDVFNVNLTGGSNVQVNGGGGDDLFRLNSTADPAHTFAGSVGQSNLVSYGSPSFDGSDGNDRFVMYGAARAGINGGDGYDLIDASRSLVGYSLRTSDLDSNEGAMTGNDKIIGAVGQDNMILSNSSRDIDWFVNGKRTKLRDWSTGATVELENFNEFKGSSEALDRFFVLRTAEDLEIFDADWIQFSSATDPLQGNLNQIQHDVKISRTLSTRIGSGNDYYENYLVDDDGILNPTVIISDATGDGTVSQFGNNQVISRMGGGSILFGIEYRTPFADRTSGKVVPFEPDMTFHGSIEGDDVFIVAQNWGETTLNSYGGDDLFMLGSTIQDADGELALLRHKVHVEAGDGNDRMYANDQGPVFTTSRFSATDPELPVSHTTYYTLSDSRLLRSELSGLAEITFNTDLELVRVNGTHTNSIQMMVTPSNSTTFALSGKSEYDSDDVVGLADIDRSLTVINETKSGSGSYDFGGQAKVLHFYNLTATLTDFTIPDGNGRVVGGF